MKQQSYSFSVNVLDDIINILKEDYEMCGYISKKKNLELSNTRFKGPTLTKGQRGSCIWSKGYKKYMWHTHPNMCLGYPSPEDIFMVFKHKDKVDTSFIFSKWGIWEFSAKQASTDRRIMDIVNQANNWLYFQEIDKGIKKYITSIKTDLRKWIGVELEIYFTPWSEIDKKYQSTTIF